MAPCPPPASKVNVGEDCRVDVVPGTSLQRYSTGIGARTGVPAPEEMFAFWLSFFLPALSTALGWMLLVDPRVGVLNQWVVDLLGVSQGPFNVYSFWGIIWVHLMAHAVSSKVILLTPAFRNLDTTLEEASRMAGATAWSTFRRVKPRCGMQTRLSARRMPKQ